MLAFVVMVGKRNVMWIARIRGIHVDITFVLALWGVDNHWNPSGVQL